MGAVTDLANGWLGIGRWVNMINVQKAMLPSCRPIDDFLTIPSKDMTPDTNQNLTVAPIRGQFPFYSANGLGFEFTADLAVMGSGVPAWPRMKELST